MNYYSATTPSFHKKVLCWKQISLFCLKQPPQGQSRRPTTNLRPWRGPSSWGGNSSPSTTAESSRINCSSSWRSPSSSPQFSISLRRDYSPSCRPGTFWGALALPHTVLSTVNSNDLINWMLRVILHRYNTRVSVQWNVACSLSWTVTLLRVKYCPQRGRLLRTYSSMLYFVWFTIHWWYKMSIFS